MRACKWFASLVRRSQKFALNSCYQSWMLMCCSRKNYFCTYVQGCVCVSIKKLLPIFCGYCKQHCFSARLLNTCINVSYLSISVLFNTHLPISYLLACWFSSLVSIRLAASQPSSVWAKEFRNWCICRKSLGKLNGPLVSLPCALSGFPYPNQLNE